MAVPLDQFVKTLSQSGLMTADKVGAFLDGLAEHEKPETAEDLCQIHHCSNPISLPSKDTLLAVRLFLRLVGWNLAG